MIQQKVDSGECAVVVKKMAILKRFLCICNTRTGSLVSGCYTLAISLVCLVYFLFRYVGHKLVEDSAEYKGIIYVGFVLYGFMIVSSLVIIPGVQLDKRYLLLPWIYIVILVVLYDTGSVALLTTVHMEREKTLHAWEIIWLFFYLLRLAANCYCFTCVVSQYQELSDGRGTYDFLYKPRRRARLRAGGQFDIDTFDLPFGVHLPPYTEEDNTEHSPPSYSQIYPTAVENSSQNCTNNSNRDSVESCVCPSCTQNYSANMDAENYSNTTTQNYSNTSTQNCQCQSCTQNYSVISANTQNYVQTCANSSCMEGCDCCSISPHCDYCACSQAADNNAYVDIELNHNTNNIPVTDSNTSANRVTWDQTQRSVLSYPIMIKNGDRTINVNSSRSGVLSGNLLCGQCESTGLEPVIRQSRSGRNCYEVTVNLEWI